MRGDMTDKALESWATQEFSETDLGDKRLTARMITIAEAISAKPESPINQACEDWSDVKAAYRFFANGNVKSKDISRTHQKETAKRIARHEVVLAIQDTSYFTYSNHPKTQGLGILSRSNGKKSTETKGLIMHTTFIVTTAGLPLGILDQNIYSRPELTVEQKKAKKHNSNIPIEEKESNRWLVSLESVNSDLESKTKIVTVCDREADIYDFFRKAEELTSPVLVRASQDREVDVGSENTKRLWKAIGKKRRSGTVCVKVPAKEGAPAREALLEIRFGKFTINPPKSNVKHKTEILPKLKLSAVYISEKNPPSVATPLEWMLITNLAVNNFDEAVEKMKWYCLRWRIEVFHKILKSGLKVEECRLAYAERLIRFLTLMSIIAWRIFFATLLARSHPNLPCTVLLSEIEWKVLYAKIYRMLPTSETLLPTLKTVTIWIAKLGGYLARKKDPDPGPITIWRGWKRLFDLTEGWTLAHDICG